MYDKQIKKILFVLLISIFLLFQMFFHIVNTTVSASYITGSSCNPYLSLSHDGKQYFKNCGREYLYLGKPQTATLEFKIWNSGCGTLNYNINFSCYKNRMVPGVVKNPSGGWDDMIARDPFRSDWIDISPLSGESNDADDVDTIYIKVDTSTLEERKNPNSFSEIGEYQCNIWIDSNAVNENGKALISIVVRVGPQIAYGINGEEHDIDFGDLYRGDVRSATFQIWNKVPGNLVWNISISQEYSDYIEVYPKNGISKGPWDITNVTVKIDTNKKFSNLSYVFRPRDGLIYKSSDLYASRPGDHEDKIMIISNDIYAINRCMLPYKPTKGSSGSIYLTWLGGAEFDILYYLSECSADEKYDMLVITTNYLWNNNENSG